MLLQKSVLVLFLLFPKVRQKSAGEAGVGGGGSSCLVALVQVRGQRSEVRGGSDKVLAFECSPLLRRTDGLESLSLPPLEAQAGLLEGKLMTTWGPLGDWPPGRFLSQACSHSASSDDSATAGGCCLLLA